MSSEDDNDIEIMMNSYEEAERKVAEYEKGFEVVQGFKPTVRELELLIEHYIDEGEELDFFCAWSGMAAGSSEAAAQLYASKRLDALMRVLGRDRSFRVISDVLKKWERKWTELREDEKNLTPCKKCGGKRTILDEVRDDVQHPNGLCGECT